ncbi:MAG: hypothetical protein U1E62_17635 [Alsobacter sp.]
MQRLFERIAGMSGIAPPEAAARLLLEHVARIDGDGGRRRAAGQDAAWARTEAAKWFFQYRRRDVPRSIAAYMAQVEALYRSAGSPAPAQASSPDVPSAARL